MPHIDMPNFSKNPLFRRATKKLQRTARKEWNQTTTAKAIKQIRNASRNSNTPGHHIRNAVKEFGKTGVSDIVMRSLLSTNLGSLVSEVQKYSRSSGSTGRLVNELLGSLGPLGSLIQTVLGAKNQVAGLQGDIQSAIDFLDAVAPDTLSSRGRSRSRVKKKPATRRKTKDVADQIEAAKQFLEGQGYEIKEPKQPGGSITPAGVTPVVPMGPLTGKREAATFPGGVSKTTAAGKPRKVVDIDLGGKGKRRFPASHPIVTKRMVLTPESSNVYSYSYDVDKWTLYVRFQSNAGNGAPGSLYGYSSVPPQVFLRMYAAPSKGTFIWDNIRIRGTVSGHKYDYRLVAVRNDYVPRKATMTGEGEMFVPRTVRVKRINTGKIRVLRSGGTMRPKQF